MTDSLSPSGHSLTRVGFAPILLVFLLPVLGCGEANPGQWTSLARGLGRPEARLAGAALPAGKRVKFEERDGALWGRVRVEGGTWKATELPNLVKAPAALLGLGQSAYRLEVDGTECQSITSAEGWLKFAKDFEPGTFGYWQNSLILGLRPGETAPEEAILRVRLDAGATDANGFHQVHGRRFSGRGLSIWPGQALERSLAVPADSVLRFATCVEAASATELADNRVVFRITLDGRTLFEHEQVIAAAGSYGWHEVRVPEESNARLVFEVTGPFAYTTFMDPVLGPAAKGTYAARPWAARPSIVVFLADTFRADNLAFYGGPEGVTPELGSFAEDCLRFERAWSVGTFTLTGHSSLFSGLYPRQTASTASSAALPQDVETIAEVLARAGYRTGAITDSAVVSLRFGLHQGFAWFDECNLALTSTLERAQDFLDADDGRPVFLFVQTYRTHLPYREHERPPSADPSDSTDIDEFQSLLGSLRKIGGPKAALQREPERARTLAMGLKDLYRRGASDLDRGFGLFWRDLVTRGFPAAGYLVFTSDHGEAFYEHEDLFHQGKVFEEQTRIPLLIAGPAVQPGTVRHAASLVDLSPTLAAMARVPSLPLWQGTNLLELGRERALFAFECADAASSTIAIVQGPRKLIALEETAENRLVEPWRAYDLSQDPHETRDLLMSQVWPAELFHSSAPTVDALLVPLVGGKASTLEAYRLQELYDFGYTDD